MGIREYNAETGYTCAVKFPHGLEPVPMKKDLITKLYEPVPPDGWAIVACVHPGFRYLAIRV